MNYRVYYKILIDNSLIKKNKLFHNLVQFHVNYLRFIMPKVKNDRL